MEFSSKEDINAKIEDVFAVLSDVDTIERQALRRGVEVRRKTSHSQPTEGMQWEAGFSFRGRKRASIITLTRFDPPSNMVFDSVTGGLETQLRVELLQLTRAHTRVTTTAILTPTTLSARLLVQSMKLAKSKINRRFAVRMAQFAREIEDRAGRLV